MIINHNEQSLRQSANLRLVRASRLLRSHSQAAKLKAVLAAVVLVLLAVATLCGLHLLF